jgi:2-amino-4-hydroxy-6-hydroxymethyldihydropteridine diphosphokinase
VIKQDILEKQAKSIYLSIGTNLGDKTVNINKAKFHLEKIGIKIITSSSIYESDSWPDPKFPKYFNVVLNCITFFKPLTLLNELKKIEILIGRKSSLKNHPRICDIDIIDYDHKFIKIDTNIQNLTTPHPRMHLRNFVLFPLFEICKDWKHPKKNKKIYELLQDLKINNIRSIKQL